MSMTIKEAARIAKDRATQHAAVTFDCAANVLREAGRLGNLEQLATIKADISRAIDAVGADDMNHCIGRLHAAALVHGDAQGNVWKGK